MASVAGTKTPADFTAIQVLLLRLPAQKTDVVVSINVPHAPGEYVAGEVDIAEGRMGALIERAMGYRERIVQSLRIEDFGLFGEE